MKRLILCCLAVVAVGLAATGNVQAQTAGNHTGRLGVTKPPADFHGGLVTPALPKPRFVLTETSGAPFDFWSKTQGRVTLLFFGYTRCPDVCPMHMTYLASALKKLPPALASNFTVVFVTTDPEHDNPRVLRAWLDNFDKRFIGLTGSQAAIDAAQIAANIPPAQKSVLPNGASGVNHAAFVLAYTKDNLAHVIYPSGISQSDWLHDLPELASTTWNSR
jgi:protein SCO1